MPHFWQSHCSSCVSFTHSSNFPSTVLHSMVYPLPYPPTSCFVFSFSLSAFLCEFNSASPRWHFSEFLSHFFWGIHSLFLHSWLVAWRNGTAFHCTHLKVSAWELPVLTNNEDEEECFNSGIIKSNRIGFVQLWKFWLQNEALGAKWRQLNGAVWRQLQVSQTETNRLGTGVWSRSAPLSCVQSKCHSGPSSTAAHLSRTLAQYLQLPYLPDKIISTGL